MHAAVAQRVLGHQAVEALLECRAGAFLFGSRSGFRSTIKITERLGKSIVEFTKLTEFFTFIHRARHNN